MSATTSARAYLDTPVTSEPSERQDTTAGGNGTPCLAALIFHRVHHCHCAIQKPRALDCKAKDALNLLVLREAENLGCKPDSMFVSANSVCIRVRRYPNLLMILCGILAAT